MHIQSWYGDLCIRVHKATYTFAIIPRCDVLTGRWLWFERVIHVVHRAFLYGDQRFGPNYSQHYYFEPHAWLMLCLKEGAKQ